MELPKKEEEKLEVNLKMNEHAIEELLGNSSDLEKRQFHLFEPMNIKASLFFIDGLVNGEVIDHSILTPLIVNSKGQLNSNEINTDKLSTEIINNIISNPAVKALPTYQAVADAILSGDSVLLIDHCDQAFSFSTKGWDARGVEEPQSETVVRGPRDGFVENVRTNTALVRRRVRDVNFRIESMKIGARSKTDVSIAYIEGIAKDKIVKELRKRLRDIEIDAVLESGYIEELINDAPYSPFLTVQGTERPDKVAASLYEGRIAIFVDNTPFVLIVPAQFWQFLQASDDYYTKFFLGTFFRILRYIAFVISLTLPSIFVMLVSFHQEMIPTLLAIAIASGREVVPFPVLFEALMMELAFELMREAGLRMPKPIGQAVSIVGSLIIGQAAVDAGLVSPIMIIVVATTGIASFTIPNYDVSYSIRLLRFPLLIASGTMGLVGFSFIFVVITLHALSLRSFGEPYLGPIIPMDASGQKDTIIRIPWWGNKNRPTPSAGDTKRKEENQKPGPPKASSAKQGNSDDTKNGNSNDTKSGNSNNTKKENNNADKKEKS